MNKTNELLLRSLKVLLKDKDEPLVDEINKRLETHADLAYEQCDCDVDKFEAWTAECGCGETHARLFRDNVIHWQGKHWRLECAFEEALRRLQP